MLLSLVNKETTLGLVIGQNLCRRGDRTESWEEESRDRQTPWFSSLGWTLVRLMLVSHSQVAIHTIRNGLNQDVRVSQ